MMITTICLWEGYRPMLTPIDFSNKRIVLGSSSAQRKKILRENLGISDFEVIKSDFEENIDKASCATVEEYVERTCRGKFDDIMQNKIAGDEPDLLLCADTVIAIKEDDGKEKETILEKASDRAPRHIYAQDDERQEASCSHCRSLPYERPRRGWVHEGRYRSAIQ